MAPAWAVHPRRHTSPRTTNVLALRRTHSHKGGRWEQRRGASRCPPALGERGEGRRAKKETSQQRGHTVRHFLPTWSLPSGRP